MTLDIPDHADLDWLDDSFPVLSFSRADLLARLGLTETERRQLDDLVMVRIAGRIEDYFKDTTFWEALEVYTQRELELAQARQRVTARSHAGQPATQEAVLGLIEGLHRFREAQGWLLIPEGRAARDLVSLEAQVAVLYYEDLFDTDPDLPTRLQATYRQAVMDGVMAADTLAAAYAAALPTLKVPISAGPWAEDEALYNQQLEAHLTTQDFGMMAWLLLQTHLEQSVAQIHHPLQKTQATQQR